MSKKKIDHPIDIVIAWVDGGDPEWQREKACFTGADVSASAGGDCRYRDWDNLQYLFRGIEKFMPWVRKVHLVTWGHLPKWLNTAAPKLKIVKHTDYIPAEYLPTFNVNPIEMNFHRIEGLAEHFIYFNDDTFPIRPLTPDVFFRGGLPCEEAVLDYITSTNKDLFPHILINDVDVLNRHFSKKQVIRKNLRGWYSPKYGMSHIVRNLLFSPFGNFPGIKWFHLPAPLLKSTYEYLWEHEFDVLNRTSLSHMRSLEDVNVYLVRNWNIASGRFAPYAVHKSGQLFLLPSQSEDLLNAIRTQSLGLVCANDTEDCSHEQFEELREKVNRALDSILPDKSQFEL